MRIEIESDVFDIVNRIKEIDDGYKIMLNLKTGRLEVHNTKQQNTFCFVINGDSLDERVIDKIYSTLSCNADNIMEDIDNNNQLIEKKSRDKLKDYTDYMSREIYSFSNNSSKAYDFKKAFCAKWR